MYVRTCYEGQSTAAHMESYSLRVLITKMGLCEQTFNLQHFPLFVCLHCLLCRINVRTSTRVSKLRVLSSFLLLT